MIDRTGHRYGQLTVLKLSHVKHYKSGPRAEWLCKCDCGKITIVDDSNLRSGKTFSCGSGGCKAKTRLLHHGVSVI